MGGNAIKKRPESLDNPVVDTATSGKNWLELVQIFWLPVSLMAAIMIMVTIPGQSAGGPAWIGLTPPAVNNILHVPVYGVLAWLWYRSLTAYGKSHQGALWLAVLVAGIYGVLNEVIQIIVPGRYASLTDILLNLAGVALCVIILRKKFAFHH